MKNFKNYFLKIYSIFSLLILPASLFAQIPIEITSTAQKEKKEFVKGTFENAIVLNNQTIENTRKNSLDFMMQHRFGVIKNAKDLYGLYAPANIRLGLTYGIVKNISLGIGVTKDKMIYDFNGKATLLRQTKQKGIPVSIAYYGNIGLSARAKENFLNQDSSYKATNKLTYFNEIMVARKFNNHISAQLGLTYSHINLLDSIYQQHDFVGGSLVARYKFSPQSSLMIDFDYLFNVSGIDKTIRPKPNLTVGYEVSTGSHQFQVFFGTARAIINQENRVFNQNEFVKTENGVTKIQVVFGFNITRVWDF